MKTSADTYRYIVSNKLFFSGVAITGIPYMQLSCPVAVTYFTAHILIATALGCANFLFKKLISTI